MTIQTMTNDLKEFLEEKFPEIDDIDKRKSNIELVEMKNYIKSAGANKIPRFNLKLYAFVYNLSIDFAKSKFNNETITTNKFFGNVHRYIKVKIHLHHSHITGEIFGYSHDFCNWKVKETKNEIPLVAHNQFGFHMFYFIKGCRTSAYPKNGFFFFFFFEKTEFFSELKQKAVNDADYQTSFYLYKTLKMRCSGCYFTI